MPSAELIVDLLLRLVLPAALASLTVGALAVRFLPERFWGGALGIALAAGLLCGNWLREPLPYLPYDVGWPALLPMAAAAWILSATATTFLRDAPIARLAIFVIVAMLAAACLIPDGWRTAGWFLGFTLLVLANASVLERQAEQRSGWFAPVVWGAVLAGGAAAVLIYAHSARLADAAILLAASLLGVAVVGARIALNARSLALGTAIYLPAVLLAGYDGTFSEVPAASFALPAVAPLFLAFAELPVVRRWPARWQTALQVALPLLPVLTAVALAIRAEGFALGY